MDLFQVSYSRAESSAEFSLGSLGCLVDSLASRAQLPAIRFLVGSGLLLLASIENLQNFRDFDDLFEGCHRPRAS